MTGMATNDPNAPPETEVKAGFQAMLEELKVNSRPHLTTLTILAGEYRQFAKQIVGLIENQLNRVRKYRLPIMYLIDSIVKEFPEDYVPIFSSNLVYLFSETFKVQAESRTKLYDLRNTWDDVFAPSLLYTLDITVKKLDKNWPVRVQPIKKDTTNSQSRNTETTSDEFSSASDNDDNCQRKRQQRRQTQTNQKQRTMSNGPNVGSTGMVVKAEAAKEPTTPTSVHSRSQMSSNEGHSPKTKSRPPSNVGTSPRSERGSVEGGVRQHRVQSLDERLSSLSESRAQSEASDTSFENTLAIDENISINSPKVEKFARGNFRHFVPPISASRFDSPSDISRRGSRGSLPGSTVSSPRVFNSRGPPSVTSIPLSRNRTETGVQVKTSSTTRSVQTGQFQKEVAVMATVTTADASTQKKLRKPKQCNFMQQFTGHKKSQAIQASSTMKTTGSQWSDNDCKKATLIGNEVSKGFEFRNAVTRFLASSSARAADSILRRLHEHQKSNQLCDLTISLGHNESDKVRCHKYIVAMVSDVIQAESVMRDEIIFSNIKRDILSQLIDYCYTQMIGPFVDKVHVTSICDGIKKLKIRQLDPVVDMIQEGQRKGVDYCGSAISGMELISADIVTAAMLGQAIPADPLSSLGLVDLQENGVNDFLPDLDSDDDDVDDADKHQVNTPKSPASKSIPEKKTIRSEEAIPLKKRKSTFQPSVKSSESSSESDDSQSENDEDLNVRKGTKMVLDKQGGPGRPRRKLVQLTKTPTTPRSEEPKMPKKRKVNGTPGTASAAQKSAKRPRRKTSEGIEKDSKSSGLSVLESITSSNINQSPQASPRVSRRQSPAPKRSNQSPARIDKPKPPAKSPKNGEVIKKTANKKKHNLAKLEAESNSEKENEKVVAMKPLSIRLKPLSKSQIHEPADNLESIVDDDRVASENDSDTDKTKDKQRNAARRRTLAADASTVNKEKKTAQRRKSIQPTLHKDPIVPQCCWDGDEIAESNLLISRHLPEFKEKTGHRMMCTYISELVAKKNTD